MMECECVSYPPFSVEGENGNLFYTYSSSISSKVPVHLTCNQISLFLFQVIIEATDISQHTDRTVSV